MATAENLLIAALCGVAGRAVHAKAPRDVAVAELRKLSTDPRVLGIAAGGELGAWQANPVRYWSAKDKADLLDAAGADPEVRDAEAAAVRARMS